MKPAAQTTFAERAGRAFGRMWRGFARCERKAVHWLVARGVPADAATALLWAIKLVVLGVLLYAAFWLALLLVFAIVAAWVARNADWDDDEENQPQWRVGPAGYGLYRGDIRVDIGDPYEDE
ncbi:hypothetical protein C1I89_32930 [Achromobacter pulmonis]|uniref:DUF3742 domain-containing protein n=1 Tax=Achromobacter pulmonis TaxID=1389932 RepID=A0A2N8K8L1_9BURK|nr:DUF3742 family protein [Achromobacter pulmonis]MBO9333148.1 DUF3742 family protein [Achromobacter xylosoxidans]PND29791.1 hypothetical protein C1I89_32930 [Achromobacter pulmonis]